eukprot:CAMPEP_0170565740 /NCGR_PEP_ID=MMETSP0211-20121228/79380_1 /TAXON_ID=311385 /ORGANISM="Pseudokeronopsis sp., Strain OXSARD2" /LENGTH=54 /DNA_ID=CAMNT_0010886699 /DNA_START=245 /DNA_END=409 /DNA_ORIENTATION=+
MTSLSEGSQRLYAIMETYGSSGADYISQSATWAKDMTVHLDASEMLGALSSSIK